MCGRYYRKSDKQKIAAAFQASKIDYFPLPPWDYNVAPQTMQPIIRANRDTGERELIQLRWGLVSFCTKSLADLKRKSTINARADSVTKGWWAQPFNKRRCLVLASGFLRVDPRRSEEQATVRLRFGKWEAMAFAGLWDAWKNPADGSCSILVGDNEEDVGLTPTADSGWMVGHLEGIDVFGHP